MKEQIEEMAKVICKNYGDCSKCSLKSIDHDDTCSVYQDCEALYNAGYRKLPDNIGEFSDGYHTFNELYHHRAVLFSVICNMMPEKAWKSKLHDTGDMYDGMFIVGIETEQGQATYHYDIEPYWDIFKVKELEKAPKWDGHTPSDAIERIGNIDCDGFRKQEWISIADRLPEESVDVLVVVKIGNRVSVDTDRIYGGKWFNYGKLGHLQGYVTHWMPLPEPPKMKGGAE